MKTLHDNFKYYKKNENKIKGKISEHYDGKMCLIFIKIMSQFTKPEWLYIF